MPLHLFWSMTRHLERIRAERDMRSLHIAAAAGAAAQGSGEMLKQVHRNLKNTVGLVFQAEEETSSKDEILRIMKG